MNLIASMRKPASSSTVFWAGSPIRADRRPTGGAIHLQTPSSWKMFLVFPHFAHRRLALLPFALLNWSISAPVPVGVLQSKNGCCHLRPELNVSVRKLRSGVYAQSPELGDWLLLVKILFLLRCCLPALPHRWPSLAVPQRFIHFPRYPQPMQQNRQLPRHRHHGPLLGVLGTTCA